jgi:hypothetical protein
MCIWFLKGEDWDESQHPMNFIAKAIDEFLLNNGVGEQELRDHLADLDEKGLISGCGCGNDRAWQFTETPMGYEIIIEPYGGSLYKVIIDAELTDGYTWERTNRSDAIDGYDDMVIVSMDDIDK